MKYLYAVIGDGIIEMDISTYSEQTIQLFADTGRHMFYSDKDLFNE